MKRLFRSILLLFGVAALSSRAWAGMVMVFTIVDADRVGFLLKASDAEISAVVSATDGARVVDVDKAWHGIHFLLTGSAEPKADTLSLVIYGGRPIGVDLGYGPAHLLMPAEVKKIAAALKQETVEKISRRFDMPKMQKLGIYPEIWVDDWKAKLQYLIGYYQMLSALYEKAAASGSAMLVIAE